jgi:bifunctional polynucleotide phosphatase/kinase
MQIDQGLFVYGPQEVIDTDRVFAFDLDHTLIEPRGNRIHPKSKDDWEWIDPIVPRTLAKLREKAPLVIFTNQAGISKGSLTIEDFTAKLDQIFDKLGFSILTFISTEHNKYRKPSPAMFELLIENYAPDLIPGNCMYTGDGAGRENDFSASDYKFALNTGMQFQIEANAFGYRCVEAIPHPVNVLNKYVCPRDYYDQQFTARADFVMMIGRPACGKSYLARRYFADYTVINQDTVNNGRVGTRAQCLRAVKRLAAAGQKIVLDNTSPGINRNEFINIAREHGMTIMYVHVTLPRDACEHLNAVRNYLGGRRVPAIAYVMFDKQFTAPIPIPGDILITIDKLPMDIDIMSEQVRRLLF